MRSAQLGMFANALLAAVKLVAGIVGNTYALIADAVESTAHHRRFFTSRVSEAMYEELVTGRAETLPDRLPPRRLTARQAQVVRLLAQGKSNKEVGVALGIGERTAETHRSHIMRKLGLRSFSELVRFALRERIVDE